MSDPNAQDASAAPQPPDEGRPARPASPDLPTTRYPATLRLIRSRLDDETRTKPKPWWKKKS